MDLLRVERVRTIGNLEDPRRRRDSRYSSRLTGGFEPREASDGRTVYYVDRSISTCFEHDRDGQAGSCRWGPELTVFSGVTPGAWDIADAGIIFVTGCRPAVAVPRSRMR